MPNSATLLVENTRLRKQLQKSQTERDILKTATVDQAFLTLSLRKIWYMLSQAILFRFSMLDPP